MIGSTVDKYEVLQKVGEGGMATVYRGRHTTLDRDVAIKVLHPHLSSSTRNRKRFAREARAIEHLRHENILEIFDYSGIDSGDCYIITEFVDGQTLTALVEERGRLPSELVAVIGVRLCRALGYAHASGILHRDMKPDNVMVRDDGTVKLMDFGIARFLDESQVTLTGALVGSPAFMSPEQAVEAPLDTRSDLFSLGTVLFYLVTGELPFSGSNPSLILKNVIEGNRPNVAELAPAISPTLADAIERLMATSPEGRFNTAAEVSEALMAVLSDVGIATDDPAWCIQAWLAEPDAFEKRLQEHVSRVVLATGKALLADGDALGALRHFNRLLALDEENEEVLELVASLHVEPEKPRRPVTFGLGLAAVVLTAGALVMWFVRPPRTDAASDPDAVLAVHEPRPDALPEPAPDPVAAPALPDPTPQPEPSPRDPETRPTPVAAPVPAPPPRPTPRPRPPPQPAPAPLALVEPAPVVLPSGPATLRVVSNMAADIYQQGRKLGNTRAPLELQPGAYVLEIRSDVVKPYELRIELGPGESLEKVVNLEARPAPVRFAASFPDACTVSLNGASLGTLGALGHRIEVPRPNQHGHVVQVACPDAEVFEHVWSDVVFPDQVIGP
ncbi:MAG: serine/threonine protein kinase [Alphaproteobacteria bacterium]|nr:serine/threonine protein kinase [Alphaproteobacteria bacterium]